MNTNQSIMRKVSNAQAKDNRRLIEVYKNIDRDRPRICTGCGCRENLSHSHIVSRKDHELMAEEKNITFHCLSMGNKTGCAFKWEQTGQRLQLRDYIKNMEYIKSVRMDLFRTMIVKDTDYYMRHPDCEGLERNFDYLCNEYKGL